MQSFNNKIAISYSELVPAIISKYNYDVMKNRGKITVLQRGCLGTPALIDFYSLPDKTKDAVKRVYGSNVVELALRNPLAKFLENDVKAFDFFDTYEKPDGTKLPPEKVREYTGNAIALNAIRQLFDNKKARIAALGRKIDTKATWETVIQSLQALQGEWGWKMPTSERALRVKIKEYKTGGYEALLHKGIANGNSAKVSESGQEALLRMLLRNPANFNNVEVQKMYNEVAEKEGWKTITEKNIAKLREEWKLFVETGRRGAVHFMNNYAMQSKRKDPYYPLLYWTLDGWEAELLYQKTFVNAQGKSVTTYHNRLRIVVVLDVCKKYPVGYAIGDSENSDLIKQAIRNALTHTAELFGSIHRPQQMQSDRFAIKELEGFLENITPRYTPAKPKNAKAKRIEPYFGYLNKKYCRWAKNWGGFGVKAGEDNQPSIDFINETKKNFPDREGCVLQLVDMIEAERKELAAAYMERWQELPADYRLVWNTGQYLYHAGETTGYTNRMTGAGLIATIGGEKRTYDCFDINFRRYTQVDWAIKFDRTDLKTVLATNADGTLRFLLEEKYVQPMALVDRTEEDTEELTRLNRFNKKMNDIIEEVEFADKGAVDYLFSTRPELSDTLAKMQITDSAGQHKIYRRQTPALLAESINQKAESKEERKAEREQQRVAVQTEADRQTAINEYHATKIDINEFLNDD